MTQNLRILVAPDEDRAWVAGLALLILINDKQNNISFVNANHVTVTGPVVVENEYIHPILPIFPVPHMTHTMSYNTPREGGVIPPKYMPTHKRRR